MFFTFNGLQSQNQTKVETPSYQRWRFNFNLGVTNLLGDLGGSRKEGTHFLRDFDYQSSRYCIGGGIEHFNKKGNWGLSSLYMFTRLSGDDKYSNELSRRDRNLSVITNMHSLDLLVFYSPIESRKLRFYTGIGLFYYNPTAILNGRRYNLRGMGTEGQKLNGQDNSYSKFSAKIPVGLQFKLLDVSKSTELWMDFNTQYCFTDYLDDVSTTYADNSAIEAQNGLVAANLADRSLGMITNNSSTGSIRGNSTYNDNYMSLVFTLKTKLEFKPKDKDKDGVPDYKDECKDTKRGAAVDENGCYADKDGDDIPDYKDKCPDEFGTKANRGCPDENSKTLDDDNDGVTNDKDECPDEAGTIENNGCPEKNANQQDDDMDGIPNDQDPCPNISGSKELGGCPDSDGDHVPDNIDQCPFAKGLPENDGCPDSDNDKVPDHKDKCPNTTGTPESQGCPEMQKHTIDSIAFFANNIYFNTASSEIKTESYDDLFKVVDILQRFPNITVEIEGHTDSVGSVKKNLILSQNRANAVMDFLIQFGIDANRLKAIGYGEFKPIVDNGPRTRAKNRRVVFKINR